MAKCRHLVTTEASTSQDGRSWTEVGGYLCTWGPNAPVVPEWFDKRVGGGYLLIDHQRECGVCPCFEKAPPSQ